MSQVRKYRDQAFVRQRGCCFYCHRRMLAASSKGPLRCTAEHLVARCEGGLDRGENIAAACWECNNCRHRTRRPLSSEKFKAKRLRWASRLQARSTTRPVQRA